MRIVAALFLAIGASLAAVGCRPEPTPVASLVPLQAPLLQGVGNAHVAITTRDPRAQQFFDQGLRLAYAFDHAEAARAFTEAARLDPHCAMCAWGMAYALGPNINQPLRPADGRAVEQARRAQQLSSSVSPKEQALIEALAVRLGAASADAAAEATRVQAVCATPPRPQDADPLDIAYAQAMARVARDHADDDEVAVLYAEALLMLSPWQWWSRDGKTPREGTLAAIDTLERVLARTPDHAGANHFLIHALEASATPQRALAAAEHLGALAPDAGHLVHMPSHIHVRLGRYADAVRANQQAIDADLRLARQLRAQGYAPLAALSHHHHFLWAAASMQGNAVVALEAAVRLGEQAAQPGQPFGDGGSNDYFLALPWLAQVRFLRWGEILAQPEPKWPERASAFPRAMRHYARGMAYARTGRAADAERELAALRSAAAEPAMREQTLKGIDELTAIAAVAEASLRGEIALARKRYRPALEALRQAVTLEDALESEEPPPWPVPTRQALGYALLLSGQPMDAVRAFRADLQRHPENGWSLYGLAESLRRDRRAAAAATEVEARFRAAWQAADAGRPDERL